MDQNESDPNGYPAYPTDNWNDEDWEKYAEKVKNYGLGLDEIAEEITFGN